MCALSGCGARGGLSQSTSVPAGNLISPGEVGELGAKAGAWADRGGEPGTPADRRSSSETCSILMTGDARCEVSAKCLPFGRKYTRSGAGAAEGGDGDGAAAAAAAAAAAE